jgi:hypothetical protein
MAKAPLALVKDRFGSKEALVAAVQKLATEDLWIDRVDSDKGLDSVPNRKLLRLHDVLSGVKKDFGTRAKLIDAILAKLGHAKDQDYAARLARYPTPRLASMLHGRKAATAATADKVEKPAKAAKPAQVATAKAAPTKN